MSHSSLSVEFDPFAGPAILATAPSTEPQREVWTGCRMSDEASLAFNESITLWFDGPLDAAALGQALTELVARHEALRSTFSADGLSLLVGPAEKHPLPVFDWSGQAPEEQARRWAALLKEVVEHTFDLQKGPLFRTQLVRLSEGSHRLVITAHHIVCDGWSSAVVVKELGALYTAAVQRTVPELPAAEPWTQYAKAQAAVATAPDRATDEGYWTRQFSDELPILELPWDRPRPPVKTYAARRVDVALPPELVAALKKSGAKLKASLFSTLLSGFQALLLRLAGQEDVIVGIPSAGQTLGEHAQLIGHCVNTLPIRARVSPSAPFAQLLDSTRVRMLEAMEHQQLTYGSLLKSLPLPRDASRLPLVSVCFNLDKGLPPAALAFQGLQTRLTTNPRHFETFDLFINAVELDGAVTLEVQFNTDLFDESTVRRWLAGYELLLRGVAENPQTPVGKLPILSREDKAQLKQWNDASRIEGIDQGCVHALIEAQARKTPSHIAVEFEGQKLTYAELDARTNQLARVLRQAGVGRGERVGVCVERSAEMIVSVVAILKAGGAYIPLDPGYPAERLHYMVTDSKMKVLVTTAQLKTELKLDVAHAILAEAKATTDGVDASALPASPQSAGAEDVAYVIYTSGSTGKPKGVLVPHRAVVNLIQSVQRTPGLSERDRLLAVTTLSFDIAVSEVLLPLTVGAHIVIASREVASDGMRLLSALKDHRITFLDATPATYRLLLGAGWEKTPGLRVICTGEAMPKDLALELVTRADAVWNGYGPTETTVWSSFYEVKAPVSRILIGRPVANTQLYVLDGMGNEVPVGVKGELFIGGSGVTHGYLERPELTKERFLPDPFGEVAGRTLYKTGDVVRYLPDGNVECLGRNDFQVKLRGFRIELGEIEDALTQHPAVKQGAVIVREDRPGDKRLVAYAVTASEVSDADLRAHLKRTLPEYMIPSGWVRLPKMPLTPSGKIDRRALPAPAEGQGASGVELVEPRTASEKLVVELFREALGVARVSIHDDFFALGGHSLLASQVLARLRRDHGVELSFRKIFEAPTPARFAELVDAVKASGAKATAGVPKRTDSGPATLSLLQERLWLLEELDPTTRLVHNLPAAWRLTGPLDPSLLARSVDLLVARHETMRTVFVVEGGRRVQKILPSYQAKIDQVDLSALSADEREKELERRMDEETKILFDLAQLPLFRITLYKLGPQEHVLYSLRHNVMWDGWSFDLFLNEVAQAYSALAAGKTPTLPELPVTYADYAAWHRGWVDSPALDAQRQYWQKQLAGDPPSLDLPTDRPRPRVNVHHGGSESLKFSKAELDALTELGKSAGGTLYMVLFAGFNALLHRWSGLDDLLLGTPVRARSRPELEGLIGPFINVVVLRTRFREGMSFRQLVDQVKELTLDAFSHQDLPLEKLGAKPPVVRGLFSLQDARNRPRAVGEAEVSQIHVQPPTCSDDYLLWTMELRDGLLAVLNYNSELFDRATARRFLEELRVLLAEAVKDPSRPVSRLPLLPESERSRLHDWSQPSVAFPGPGSLPARVELLAAKSPDAVAFAIGDRPLSWSRLNAQANRLARSYREKATHEGPIVVVLEPSLELPAALLGGLKYGRPVCVVDARAPAARLASTLAALRPSVLVGRAETVDALAKGTPTLRLDADGGAIEAQDASNPIAVDPMSAALVALSRDRGGTLQTTVLTHRVLDALTSSLADRLGLAPQQSVVLAGGLESSPVLAGWLMALAVGLRVEVPSQDAELRGEGVEELLTRARPAAVVAPGRFFAHVTASGFSPADGLRAVFVGEAAPSLVEELRKRKADVWSLSGSPQTGLVAFARHHSEQSGAGELGKPLSNVRARVLEGSGEPSPILVPGALEVAAFGLPPVKSEGRARWRTDGTLERLPAAHGELPAVVGGLRAFPAEVEAVLREHPSVQTAVAVAHPDRLGERQWVAYVVVRSDASVTQTELRAHARERLPEALVPKLIVELPESPHRPDGSVDLTQIKSPYAVQDEPVEPSTPGQRLIAEVWRELLGPKAISVHDNFFDLGGYSLLCFQLVDKLEKRIGRRLSPRIFLLNTLEQAAVEMGDVGGATAAAPRAPPPQQPPKEEEGGWLKKISKVLRS